jgi:agmatinase
VLFVDGILSSGSGVKSLSVLPAGSNFLGIEPCSARQAEAVIWPLPLELTTTYIKGTGLGPEALIQASHQVELFDDELEEETFRRGIATLEPYRFEGDDPETAAARIEAEAAGRLEHVRRLVSVGGEHTVSVGLVRAFMKRHPGLTVLHLDAHADLRDSYEGSPLNHACVMSRIAEIAPFVSVGIRSLSVEEHDQIRDRSFAAFGIHRMRKDPSWSAKVLERLGGEVYVTLDLDVLDPSIMPSVGTPEPGGMGWYELLGFLKTVFESRTVIGMDMVELCPKPGAEHGVFSAAKLLYRTLGYWISSGKTDK